MACLASQLLLQGANVSYSVEKTTAGPDAKEIDTLYKIKAEPWLWTNGAILQVGFLGGTDTQREKVLVVAPEWSNYCNITFRFNPSVKSRLDILISFDENNGSWSHLGTRCRDYHACWGKPSMNFGRIKEGALDVEEQRTILHEFGHALGLVHQHQNRARGSYHYTAFDRKACYEAFGAPPNNWSPEEIDENVLGITIIDEGELGNTPSQRFSMLSLVQPAYDIHSVMMYQYKSNLTIRTMGGTECNTDLSIGDKIAVNLAYPPWPNYMEPDRSASHPHGPSLLELLRQWEEVEVVGNKEYPNSREKRENYWSTIRDESVNDPTPGQTGNESPPKGGLHERRAVWTKIIEFARQNALTQDGASSWSSHQFYPSEASTAGSGSHGSSYHPNVGQSYAQSNHHFYGTIGAGVGGSGNHSGGATYQNPTSAAIAQAYASSTAQDAPAYGHSSSIHQVPQYQYTSQHTTLTHPQSYAMPTAHDNTYVSNDSDEEEEEQEEQTVQEGAPQTTQPWMWSTEYQRYYRCEYSSTGAISCIWAP